jgi:hypothetical protein
MMKVFAASKENTGYNFQRSIPLNIRSKGIFTEETYAFLLEENSLPVEASTFLSMLSLRSCFFTHGMFKDGGQKPSVVLHTCNSRELGDCGKRLPF